LSVEILKNTSPALK